MAFNRVPKAKDNYDTNMMDGYANNATMWAQISDQCHIERPQQANSQLSISMEKTAEGAFRLTVADTGDGLPDGFNVENTKSLGLRLVRRLAKQLQGSVSYAYQAGAVFTVTFKDTSARALVD